eukprot:COSAG01_NODE_1311_length_10774_cov_18.218299_4_plen_318_part_00
MSLARFLSTIEPSPLAGANTVMINSMISTSRMLVHADSMLSAVVVVDARLLCAIWSSPLEIAFAGVTATIRSADAGSIAPINPMHARIAVAAHGRRAVLIALPAAGALARVIAASGGAGAAVLARLAVAACGLITVCSLPALGALTAVAGPRGSAGAAVLARRVVTSCRVGTCWPRPAALAVAAVTTSVWDTGAVAAVRLAVAARGVVAGLVVLPPRLARAGVAAAVWSALVGVRPTRMVVAARGTTTVVTLPALGALALAGLSCRRFAAVRSAVQSAWGWGGRGGGGGRSVAPLARPARRAPTGITATATVITVMT